MSAAPTSPKLGVAAPPATEQHRPGTRLRAAWETRGVSIGLLALGVGAIGETLLFTESLRGSGAALLLVAIVLAALAWGGPREASPIIAQVGVLIAWRKGLALRLAGIAGSALLAMGALFSRQANPDAIFGLQGALWLASIALFLASCARWYPSTQRESYFGPPWTRLEIGLFLGLVALTLVTYLYRLNDIPWRFHYDEAIAYEEAMRFYRGPAISLFTTTWYETSLPSLWFALAGGLMRFAGTELGGVRMAVALAGALAVVPLYGLARLVAGRTAATLVAFFWATTPVAIHYSRISIINMTTPLAWTVCFYFLLRGLRSRRPGDFAWSGLAAGLGMYTYFGTRLLPYLLLAYAAYMALFHFRRFREQARHFAVLGVGFFVGFGPLLGYFLSHPGAWAARGLSQMTIPAEIPTTWDALVFDWNTLSPIVDQNLLSLSVISTSDRCYWGPFLSPAQAVLLFLGVGALVWRWRQPGAFLVLLWGAGVLFVGGTLVSKVFVPAFNHWTPAFPAIFVAMALPPALWLRALGQVSPPAKIAGYAAVTAGAVCLAAVNLYTYAVVYPKSVPASFEWVQGRYLATLGPDDRVRIVGNSWQPVYPMIAEMMAPHVTASDFLNPSRQLPLAASGDSLVFLLNVDQTVYLPIIQGYYPGGVLSELLTSKDSSAFAYRVPASVARSPRQFDSPGTGLLVTISGKEGVKRVDPFVGASVWGDPGSGTLGGLVPPVEARDPELVPLGPMDGERGQIGWEGELYAEGGVYTMELRTDARALLEIDGQQVLNLCDNVPDPRGVYQPGGYPWRTATATLTQGWHPVRLALEPTGNYNGLEWAWTRPDGVREIVPPTRFRHNPTQPTNVSTGVTCGP
jgi:hypothetical protein